MIMFFKSRSISFEAFAVHSSSAQKEKFDLFEPSPSQVILAGTLTGVQGDIRYKVLEALSTVK